MDNELAAFKDDLKQSGDEFDAATCGEDDIIHRLGRVYRKHVRNAERLTTRRFGVRMTEFTILHMLAAGGPLRLRRIATARVLQGEDVFLVAGTLLERGLIRFVKTGEQYGPAEVTPLGRRLAEKLGPTVLARQTALTEHLPKHSQTRLVNMLIALEAMLDLETTTQAETALEIDQLADIMDGNDIAA